MRTTKSSGRQCNRASNVVTEQILGRYSIRGRLRVVGKRCDLSQALLKPTAISALRWRRRVGRDGLTTADDALPWTQKLRHSIPLAKSIRRHRTAKSAGYRDSFSGFHSGEAALSDSGSASDRRPSASANWARATCQLNSALMRVWRASAAADCAVRTSTIVPTPA